MGTRKRRSGVVGVAEAVEERHAKQPNAKRTPSRFESTHLQRNWIRHRRKSWLVAVLPMVTRNSRTTCHLSKESHSLLFAAGLHRQTRRLRKPMATPKRTLTLQRMEKEAMRTTRRSASAVADEVAEVERGMTP
jgi:hypothetical protein